DRVNNAGQRLLRDVNCHNPVLKPGIFVFRKLREIALIALGLCCLANLTRAQDQYTVESPGSGTLAQVPKVWRAALESKGTQLETSVNGVTTPVAAIWFAKTVVGSDKASSASGGNYPHLMPGAVLGVLFFPADTPEPLREDAFDQKLAPGFYSLRYAHMSIASPEGSPSQSQDFVLLTPIESDPFPDQVRSKEELLKMSRLASTSATPAAISLVDTNPAYKELPAAIADDAGQCILQTTIHVVTGTSKTPREMPLAIVLVTPKGEDDAS